MVARTASPRRRVLSAIPRTALWYLELIRSARQSTRFRDVLAFGRGLSTERQRKMSMSNDFTPEQKRYLEGFVSGLQSRRGRAQAGRGRRRLSRPDPTRRI